MRYGLCSSDFATILQQRSQCAVPFSTHVWLLPNHPNDMQNSQQNSVKPVVCIYRIKGAAGLGYAILVPMV